MKSVKFTVPGEPVGKGRPRFSRYGVSVKTYTPQKTADYEALVSWEYSRQAEGIFFADGEYVYIDIDAYYTIPKSTSKKRAAQMKIGNIRPAKKPDVDNIIKSICDGLNGVAYKDDSQIVRCTIEKYYSDEPHVDIYMTGLNEEGREA